MVYNRGMKSNKLSFRTWLSFILVGLVGQIAWAIENNELNLFIYSQTKDASYITWMTTASAIVATLTTFFMGALSDRLGKRKIFICGGYILWGLTVFLFGVMSYQNMEAAFPFASAAFMVGVMMTVMDCVMTLFGSTANDACFNAYVTDMTDETNRGKVESVLSVLPLVANVLMAVGLLIFEASSTTGDTGESLAETAAKLSGPWFNFFLSFGILVTAVGVISIFLLPKDNIKPNRDSNYWANLIYGFKPSTVKTHKDFYIALLAFMAFNTAIDAFMPYYLVYFQNDVSLGGLGFGGDKISVFYLCFFIILIVASVLVIIVGLFMDKMKKTKLLIPAIALAGLGFVGMYFSKSTWSVILSGILMMGGYLIGTAVLGASVRDETPVGEVGLFQGVRMVFAVLLPMIIGSNVSQAVFNLGSITYTDPSTFVSTHVPTNAMFLVSLCFILVSLAPALWLIKRKNEENRYDEKQENPII